MLHAACHMRSGRLSTAAFSFKMFNQPAARPLVALLFIQFVSFALAQNETQSKNRGEDLHCPCPCPCPRVSCGWQEKDVGIGVKRLSPHLLHLCGLIMWHDHHDDDNDADLACAPCLHGKIISGNICEIFVF